MTDVSFGYLYGTIFGALAALSGVAVWQHWVF